MKGPRRGDGRDPSGLLKVIDNHLLLDGRRQIVSPWKVVPPLAELARTFAWMFDAIFRVTHDKRWLEARQVLLDAIDILQSNAMTTSSPTPPAEREPRTQFAPTPATPPRKGQAMAEWPRKTFEKFRDKLDGLANLPSRKRKP